MEENEYRTMIARYGNSLRESEKIIVRKAFAELLDKGKSLEWICAVIDDFREKERTIAKYKNMLFSTNYQEEIDELLEEKHRIAAENKEKVKRIIEAMEEREKREPIIIVRKKKEKTNTRFSLDDV